MSIVDWMKDDIHDLFEDAAEDILYRTQGKEIKIQAIAEIGTNDKTKTPHNLEGSYSNASFTLLDDAELGITEPYAGDEIVYHGNTFIYVNMEQHNPNVIWRLRFLAKESAVPFNSIKW
nr:MAG TPA: ATP-binding sugar transporter [Caudoviricetes sp.]